MKNKFLASLLLSVLFCACGLGVVLAADSGVYQFVPSESMDQLMDHVRNVCLSKPTLAANGSVAGNLDIGASGEKLIMRIQNKLASYDVGTAKAIDVDAASGVSWYTSAGVSSTFAGIKTVAAGKCSGFLVLADDTATTPAWVMVRAPDVPAATGAKAKLPPIPAALRKTHAPIAFLKFNNATASAVALGTLALSDGKVTLFNLSTALHGEEL